MDNLHLLNSTIQDIRKLLDDPSFSDPNEQSVKQGIILPILQSLSWPIINPNVVYPEYPVEGGRVDYALCENRHPIILIEAKRFNRIDGAEWQVFQYSFHVGTPMVILTDGLVWRFFMMQEEGAYYERLLCSIQLMRDDVNEITQNLCKYLKYEDVVSRKAIDQARDDYRKKRKCSSSQSKENIDSISANKNKLTPKMRSGKSKSSASCRFIFKEKEFSAKNRQEAAAILLNTIADSEPAVLERIAELPRHGQGRRYLGKSQSDIYPDNPARAAQKTFQFRPGWWIPGGLGTRTLTIIAQMICEAADLTYGKDIILLDNTA